jgi:hypothetical protein
MVFFLLFYRDEIIKIYTFVSINVVTFRRLKTTLTKGLFLPNYIRRRIAIHCISVNKESN